MHRIRPKTSDAPGRHRASPHWIGYASTWNWRQGGNDGARCLGRSPKDWLPREPRGLGRAGARTGLPTGPRLRVELALDGARERELGLRGLKAISQIPPKFLPSAMTRCYITARLPRRRGFRLLPQAMWRPTKSVTARCLWPQADRLGVNELRGSPYWSLVQLTDLLRSYDVGAGRRGCCTYLLYCRSAVLQPSASRTLSG